MYPDLSYLFHDLIGTPRDNFLSIFKTFGFLLVMAILVAAWLFKKELKRRAALGQFTPEVVTRVANQGLSAFDYALNGLFGFLVGFKLIHVWGNLPQMQRDPAGVLLSAEGNFLAGVAGAVLVLTYYYYQDRKIRKQPPQPQTVQLYPHDRIGTITTIAAISGVIGAKVFALIEDLPTFFADPVGVFFSGSGLAIYGGLIGGFVGCYLYLRKHNTAILPTLDAVAPALMVAYGVGRIGCQLSGDGDWGDPSGPVPAGWWLPDWMWGFDYPHNVLREGVAIPGCEDFYCTVLPELVYPSPFYETVMAFVLGALLWGLRKRLTPIPGLLFAIYLVLNGIERWTIEKIRVNDEYDVLGMLMTQAEIIAVGFVLAGIGMGIWAYQRKRSEPGSDAEA